MRPNAASTAQSSVTTQAPFSHLVCRQAHTPPRTRSEPGHSAAARHVSRPPRAACPFPTKPRVPTKRRARGVRELPRRRQVRRTEEADCTNQHRFSGSLTTLAATSESPPLLAERWQAHAHRACRSHAERSVARAARCPVDGVDRLVGRYCPGRVVQRGPETRAVRATFRCPTHRRSTGRRSRAPAAAGTPLSAI